LRGVSGRHGRFATTSATTLATQRIIFLTGDTLGPDIAAFLERSRGPSLNKPFALDEVRRVVQHVLRVPEGR
jgi:DNA-binding response OmpR family regulator